MTHYETPASIEAAQDATNAALESQASDAAYEQSIGRHTTSVTRVRRNIFDIARVILVVRCQSCKYRLECDDEERANREAMRHEAAASTVAAEVDHA